MNRSRLLLVLVLLLVLGAFLVYQRGAPPRIRPVPMGKTVTRVLPDASGKPEIWKITKREVPLEKLPDLVLPQPRPRIRPPDEQSESARALDAQAMEAWKHGDLQGAIVKFEAAVRADPDDPEVRSDFGHLYLTMAHYTAAWPQLKRAAELKPKDPQVWLDLATFYERNELLERSFYAQQRAAKLAGGQEIVRNEDGFFVLKGKSFP